MAEVVVSALLSSSLQVAFDRLASRQVLEFFGRRKDNEELCEKLKMVLKSMDPFVAYAELKQIMDPCVRDWLDAVREVVLNAEDLLDEIDIQITQSQLEPQSNNSWVSNLFKPSPFSYSFDKKVESSMKEVLAKLEDLKGQKDDLGLKKIRDASVGSVVKKVESTSHLSKNQDVMYGRNDDKESIINWLTSPTENGNNVSIISIVGMGGLGKTTLAQHVFNDPKVESKFDVRAWICVSDDFNVIKLTKAILETISGSTDNDDKVQRLELLQGKLKETLSGKKFLLVLDDVWNENIEQWEAMQTPLSYGSLGSKILVTTRITEVADSCMRSDKIYALKELQEDNCWKVFVKHAFNNDNHELNPEFEKIGKEIVAKCKGLPLALKAIGSLLYKKSISHWETILKSEIWQLREEKIMPALLLSYHYLPSHLKRCFAFCALFPKDFNFDPEELILLWMGENYLQCHNQNRSMEEIGKEYFDDLLSRSFFQQSSEDSEYYVMHDLLNDLAKYVCGDVCFTLEVEEAQNIPAKIRHFSFLTNCVSNFEGSKDLYKASRLRTFLPLNLGRWLSYSILGNSWNYGASICDLFSKCRFLRVLSLCDNWELRRLPDSVGNLKHLHSLDLSGTSIEKLPDSTCSLFNLYILRLCRCERLKELPPDLHKLTKLHHLDLRQTELRKLPMHLGKLKNLQVLMGSLYVDKGREFNIQHLGGVNLRGQLLISGMENIVNPSDALAANLDSKMDLVELELKWSQNHGDTKQEKEVLESLQPSKQLKVLGIKNYGGSGFPHWLGDGSLSNVMSLELTNCEYCTWLPSLGQLPYLKWLKIRGLSLIVVIGEEFYGSSSSSFASLETLFFENMKEWTKWECKAVAGAFPKLGELSIKNCPKLEESLPEQLACLEKLTISLCKKFGLKIEECGRMETQRSDGDRNMEDSSVQHSHNSLVDLSIEYSCVSLTIFPLDLFPNLHSLHLKGCDNLQMISQDQPHNHLRVLDVISCPQFESFPSKGLSAPRLERFSIHELQNLKLLSKQMDNLLPSLIELNIYYCYEVESISDERLPSKLKKLRLQHCSKLMASLKGALETNTSIQRMRIAFMNVEFFSLPPSLVSLEIFNCPKVESISNGCFPSNLKELYLTGCSKLRGSLQGALGANTSIEKLDISRMDMCFPEEFLSPSFMTRFLSPLLS